MAEEKEGKAEEKKAQGGFARVAPKPGEVCGTCGRAVPKLNPKEQDRAKAAATGRR